MKTGIPVTGGVEMRWSWLRAVLLGLLIGPAPISADTNDMDADPPDTEQQQEVDAALGWAIRGRNFYVWEDASSREAAGWAGDLMRSGGETVEAAWWRTMAEDSAVAPRLLTPERAAEIAGRIASADEDPSVTALGCMLCLLPSLDRTCLVSAWATSPSEETRLALARALAAPFDAVGVRWALEQLREDASPEVRRAAGSAAAVRSVDSHA